MYAHPHTAAIVPAYNEGKTVGVVVRALKACPLIDEVIVVSDGSTDRTAEEAAEAGADQVIRLPVKNGKGEALRRGVAATGAEILFFCDADLLGLTPATIEDILRPVLEGRLAMCAGLRDRGPFLTAIEAHLPLIGGERALRRGVFENVPARFLRGFRVEIALNYSCRINGLPYGGVPSRGVRLVRKMEKVGFWKGLLEYADMFYQGASSMIDVRLHWKHRHESR